MKINLTDLTNLQNETTAVTAINGNNSIIEAAVENSISRDGTQPNQMNSVLDMNSNRIINLPDAVSAQEPATYEQLTNAISAVDNGVVVDGAFIMAQHDDTTINDRVLVAGDNLQVIDQGAKGDFILRVSDEELNALADVSSAADKLPYFTGVGTADVTDFTAYARTLVDDVDAGTARATLGLVIDDDVQPHDPTLNSLVSAGNGIMTKTATSTITPRTVTGTANEITITNGDGVSGNPTISIPTSVTFTGKTISGGTFSSPTINTPSGITKSDVGLGNVDNTSDLNKPISTSTQTALDAKVAGPASATNNAVAIFAGTSGKQVGNSGKTLPSSTLTGISDTQTLTNKTISGSSNTLSNIANASLSSAADSTIKSNISGSSASVSDNTITAVLDKQFGTTQGSVVYRGASSWSSLTPGTSGYFLKTNGSSANPSWANIPGGGDLISTNNLTDLASRPTAWLNIIQPGAIVNSSYSETTTYGSTTAVIPIDNTIPQVGEGYEVLTGVITPKSTSNSLRVRFSISMAPSVQDNIIIAMFLNGASNAICARYSSTAANFSQLMYMEHEFVPGSTSTQTISIRVGTGGGATLYINGNSSGRLLGGVNIGSLMIEETVR